MSVTAALMSVVGSHALSTGFFDSVDGFEPKSAPGNGVTCSIWVQALQSARSSGLASTSAVVVLNLRVYLPMLADSPDSIDPSMMNAVEQLMVEYNGDFDLGGNARNVDVFGSEGTALGAVAGYVNVSGSMYRCMTITLPVIVNDAFNQVA